MSVCFINMLRMYCFLLSLIYYADATISIQQTGCLSDTLCNSNTDINITCTMTYTTGMFWKVNGTTVFECTLNICVPYDTRYVYDHNTTAGKFVLGLTPITIDYDKVEFRCTGEGTDYASFTPDVVDGNTSSSAFGTTPTHSSEKTDGNVSPLANNTITNTPFDNSTYFTATNITKTDVYVVYEAFAYLIVGGGLLFVLLVSCVIHVVYIVMLRERRCDKHTRHHIN